MLPLDVAQLWTHHKNMAFDCVQNGENVLLQWAPTFVVVIEEVES